MTRMKVTYDQEVDVFSIVISNETYIVDKVADKEASLPRKANSAEG